MEKMNSVIVAFVLKMKEIAILTMSAKRVLYVDQTIVHFHQVLTLKLIAVINQLMEMKIFVHQEFLVDQMKGIVILMMTVKLVFVAQTIAQIHLALIQEQIAAILALVTVVVLIIQEIAIVMMKTTIVDVNGMEETVVAVM